jgi:hypothetical protein
MMSECWQEPGRVEFSYAGPDLILGQPTAVESSKASFWTRPTQFHW